LAVRTESGKTEQGMSRDERWQVTREEQGFEGWKPEEREWCSVGDDDTAGLAEDEAPGDLREVERGGRPVWEGMPILLSESAERDGNLEGGVG
jgi:hypothetical protein